jgi:hypothetical protein
LDRRVNERRRLTLQLIAGFAAAPYAGRLLGAPESDAQIQAATNVVAALVENRVRIVRDLDVVAQAKTLLTVAAVGADGVRRSEATTESLAAARAVFDSVGATVSPLLRRTSWSGRHAPLGNVVDEFATRCAERLRDHPVAMAAMESLLNGCRLEPEALARLEEHSDWRQFANQAVASRLGAQALAAGATVARSYAAAQDAGNALLAIEKDAGGALLARINGESFPAFSGEGYALIRGWVNSADRTIADRVGPVVDAVTTVVRDAAATKAMVDRIAANVSSYSAEGLTLGNARSTLNIAASLLALGGNPEAAQDVIKYGGAALDIANNVSSFLSNGMTGAVLTGNVLAIGFSLMASQNSGPSADELILGQLREIRKDIAEVKEEVRKVRIQIQALSSQVRELAEETRLGFQHLSEQQRRQFSALRDSLLDVAATQRSTQDQVAFTTRYLTKQVAALSEGAQKRAEEARLTDFTRECVRAFNPSLKTALTEAEWRTASSTFSDVAINASRGPTFLPPLKSDADIEDVYIALVESGTLRDDPWSVLSIFTTAARVLHPNVTFPATGPSNARVWSAGAMALCKLIAQHRRDDIDPEILDQVIGAGDEVLAWHRNVLASSPAASTPPPFVASVEIRMPSNDAASLHNALFYYWSDLGEAVRKAVEQFEFNPTNGLASGNSDPNVSFQVRLLERRAWDSNAEPAFDVKALRLPSAKFVTQIEGVPRELPSPSLLRDLPEDFVLLDILLGRKGDGFALSITECTFSNGGGRLELTVLFDIPGEGPQPLLVITFRDRNNWFQGSEPKSQSEWITRMWPRMLERYNNYSALDHSAIDFSVEVKRGKTDRYSQTTRTWDSATKQLVPERLAALRTRALGEIAAAVRRSSSAVYPELFKLSLGMDAAAAVVAISDSLDAAEFPSVTYRPQSEAWARAVEAGKLFGPDGPRLPNSRPYAHYEAYERRTWWEFTGYWAPAVVVETMAHLRAVKRSLV